MPYRGCGWDRLRSPSRHSADCWDNRFLIVTHSIKSSIAICRSPWGRDDLGRLLVISSGSVEANRRNFNALLPEQVLVQSAFEVNELFGVVATPSALRLDRDGRVDSDLAIGGDAIKRLLGTAVPAPAKGLPALVTGAGPG